jgi:SAM-dependent methyltransferase
MVRAFFRLLGKTGDAPRVDPASIPLPPEELQAEVGPMAADHYLNVGRVRREDILSRTNVEPTASILDIGCGSGRLARHFVDYVRHPGRYVGMEIQKPAVDWCAENIAPVNPAFHFYHQDIYNGQYNLEGKYRASEYRFPFEDESFDLIILTSVFTHMLPEDTLNYLREISRLLKPSGCCYSTWFLLGHDVKVKYLIPELPEAQVGYGFRYCIELLEQCGLVLSEEPTLGHWRSDKKPRGREPLRFGQETLLFGRASGAEGSLLTRYETARMPETDQLQLEQANGSIQSMDPVSHAITLLIEQESATLRIAEGADIEVNGKKTDSSALRKGQSASLQFNRQPDGGVGVALAIVARDGE